MFLLSSSHPVSKSRVISRLARACSVALCFGALSAFPLLAVAQADLHISGGGGGGGGGGGSCGSSSAVGNGGGGGGGGGLGSGSGGLYDDYLGGGGGGGGGSDNAVGNSVGGDGGNGSFSGGAHGGLLLASASGQNGGGLVNEYGRGGQGGSTGRIGGAGGIGDTGYYGYYWASGIGGVGGDGSNGAGTGTSAVSGTDGGGGGGGGGGGCAAASVNPATQIAGNGAAGASNNGITLMDSLFGSLTISGGDGGSGGSNGSTNGGGGGGGGSISVDGSIGLEADTLIIAGGDGGHGSVTPAAKRTGSALPGMGGTGGVGDCGTAHNQACSGYGGGGGNAEFTAIGAVTFPSVIVNDVLTVQTGLRAETGSRYGDGYGGAAIFDTDSLDAPPVINLIKQSNGQNSMTQGGTLSFTVDTMNVKKPGSRMTLTGVTTTGAAPDVIQIDEMDFYLPEDLTAGATMLSVSGTGAAALNLSSTQIEVGVDGTGSSLKVGDKIVLISGVSSAPLNNSSSGTTGMGLLSIYKFDISRQGNQIIATVTQAPPELTNKVIDPGTTLVDFNVTSNMNATGYWVVLPWTLTCPSAAEIIGSTVGGHGTMNAGVPFFENGWGTHIPNFAIAPNVSAPIHGSDFYTLCFVADAGTAGSPNYSSVWQGWFATNASPAAPIVLDLEIVQSSITADSAAFIATGNVDGTGYWFYDEEGKLPSGAAPDIPTFKTFAQGTGSMKSGAPFPGTLTGLTPDTPYVLYFLEEDSGNNYSAIRSISFRTLALPKAAPGPVPTLSGIALTLLALLLTGVAAVAVRRRGVCL